MAHAINAAKAAESQYENDFFCSPVVLAEWDAAWDAGNGQRLGIALCRNCGGEVEVTCEWHRGQAHVASSGSGCGCAKEGDKFPVRVERMVATDEWPMADGFRRRFRDILAAVQLAKDCDDERGENLARIWLEEARAKWTATQGGGE